MFKKNTAIISRLARDLGRASRILNEIIHITPSSASVQYHVAITFSGFVDLYLICRIAMYLASFGRLVSQFAGPRQSFTHSGRNNSAFSLLYVRAISASSVLSVRRKKI